MTSTIGFTFHPGATVTRRRLRWMSALTVVDGEVAVVFHHGHPSGVLGAGRHRIARRGTAVEVVGTRAWLVVLPLQEVPTADGVTVRASLAVTGWVADPEAYVAAGPHVDGLVYLAVQVALREVVASLEYEVLLASRPTLGRRLADAVNLPEVGVVLDRIEIRDLVLPAELRRAQAAVLLARAEGQAALERARGEAAALRSLANAARLAADQPALLQLRLVQQLERSSGHTVILADRSGTLPV